MPTKPSAIFIITRENAPSMASVQSFGYNIEVMQIFQYLQ